MVSLIIKYRSLELPCNGKKKYSHGPSKSNPLQYFCVWLSENMVVHENAVLGRLVE